MGLITKISSEKKSQTEKTEKVPSGEISYSKKIQSEKFSPEKNPDTKNLPPAAPCLLCDCPAAWQDSFGGWHCPECEPWPARSFVVQIIKLLTLPAANAPGGAPSEIGTQADLPPDLLDDREFEKRWRAYVYTEPKVKGGRERIVIQRRDFRWV